MAKKGGKGTIFKTTISAMLTAVAQCKSISTSGFASQTFEGTCLDSAVGQEMPLTGYASPGTCDVELLWDPGLAGHQFFTDSIAVPVELANTITHSDTGGATTSFTSSGIDWGTNIEMDDGMGASLSFTITGLPVFPT